MILNNRAVPADKNIIDERNRYEILCNHKIARDVFEMTLKIPVIEDESPIILTPGQFANVKVDGVFLRRPISICNWTKETITLIYKVVGEGTDIMSRFNKGKIIDVISGLGNGFKVMDNIQKPLLIGGGVGIPPLYALAKHVISKNENWGQASIVMGFNSKQDAFYINEFEMLGFKVYVSTVDGTLGNHGFVTQCIQANNLDFDYFYSCGPISMLKVISSTCKTEGQLSLEERMGCGFGACMGCSIQTKNGSKRVCKEGPVFEKEELLWNTI